MGDFLYISVMKDLSNYISYILDDNLKMDVHYEVWYEEGTYMIVVQKHIKVEVEEVLDTYFPKGDIKYVINLFYYLA